ncbi:MAG: hypothetical protein ABI728_01095, partial [Betaproteobacteria bacterium]
MNAQTEPALKGRIPRIADFLGDCRKRIESSQPLSPSGYLTRVAGLVMEAVGLKLAVGSNCTLLLPNGNSELVIDVAGIRYGLGHQARNNRRAYRRRRLCRCGDDIERAVRKRRAFDAVQGIRVRPVGNTAAADRTRRSTAVAQAR